MTDLGTDERRLAMEAIVNLCHVKRVMAELLLTPAGEPEELYRPLLRNASPATKLKGERFPPSSKITRGNGPALAGMGAHHPAEYFAESIIDPNRVIVKGSEYTGPDGLSKMPSYADSMTLKQLVNVVAYLESLKVGEMGEKAGSMKMGHSMKMK